MFWQKSTKTIHKAFASNNHGTIVIKFNDSTFGKLESSAYKQHKFLQHPQKFFTMDFDEKRIFWKPIPRKDAKEGWWSQFPIWGESASIDLETILAQALTITEREAGSFGYHVSSKNQAPSSKHPSYHVFGIYLWPFSKKALSIGETIGGGHFDQGWAEQLTVEELVAREEWKTHFQMSGAEWAIPHVQSLAHSEELPWVLIDEIKKIIARDQTSWD